MKQLFYCYDMFSMICVQNSYVLFLFTITDLRYLIEFVVAAYVYAIVFLMY